MEVWSLSRVWEGSSADGWALTEAKHSELPTDAGARERVIKVLAEYMTSFDLSTQQPFAPASMEVRPR